jgi:hypothetical protein
VEFPLQFTKLPLSLLSHAGEEKFQTPSSKFQSNRIRPLELGTWSFQLVEHQGIASCIPVWKTGVYLSTPLLGNWNPVRELHPPVRFCGPPPWLIGQRDESAGGPYPSARDAFR